MAIFNWRRQVVQGGAGAASALLVADPPGEKICLDRPNSVQRKVHFCKLGVRAMFCFFIFFEFLAVLSPLVFIFFFLLNLCILM